jgi:DNA topoisomerase-1
MHDRHVKIDDTTLRFQFRGKSGKEHTVVVSDRRLATIVRRCQELPGHELFQYVDKQGQTQTITSGDVNAYLHLISGRDFTAKDFRTWAGTLFAARTLKACGTCTSQRQLKRRLVQTITRGILTIRTPRDNKE